MCRFHVVLKRSARNSQASPGRVGGVFCSYLLFRRVLKLCFSFINNAYNVVKNNIIKMNLLEDRRDRNLYFTLLLKNMVRYMCQHIFLN